MRRTLITFLLMSGATAVAAQEPGDAGERRSERIEAIAEMHRERAERNDSPRASEAVRPERAETRSDRSEPDIARGPGVQRVDRQVDAPSIRPIERPQRRQREDFDVGRSEQWGTPAATGGADGVTRWRWRERQERRAGRHREVPPAAPAPVLGEALSGPKVITAPGIERAPSGRPGFDVLKDRVAAEGWRRDWRQDRRYDWRRYRDRDRDRFRLGIYVDPFGWSYRRWNIGWNIYPRFYASRYWINDPFSYRLPPVYGPYRWVRYWDDALLIDLRTGRVVDVIHNVFW